MGFYGKVCSGTLTALEVRLSSVETRGEAHSSKPTSPRTPASPQTQSAQAYDLALERVMGLADFERASHSPDHSSFHLERMGLLVQRLGDPHLTTPTIHVAGTKGKGSTAAMVTSILASAGYRVGLYTSPHLHSAVERIRVGFEPTTHQEFASLVDRIWPIVEEIGREGGYGPVTTFEMLTAMAFTHFEGVGADFQVIEVGLGGRLDSTNVVEPDVCAITSISLDHVATLGDTVSRIAKEKAGIIKNGVPIVVSPQPDDALSVFRWVSDERSAPLIYVDERVSWRKDDADVSGQSIGIVGLRDTYSARLPLLGDHQLENAATATAVAEVLADTGASISKAHIESGLSSVRWPARLEVLREGNPIVVVDGAHNPYSIRRLIEAVREYFQFRRAIVVFGALGGHSAKNMAAELAALDPLVVAVRSRHPRSAPSRAVAEVATNEGLTVLYESDDVGKASRRALELAGEGDLVLGTGSLSVAAEIIEEMKGIAPELYPYIERPSGIGAGSVV